MSSPINKYEAGGIFISIAVMAVALALITLRTDKNIFAKSGSDASQGAVVVVSQNEDQEGVALADALLGASTDTGELQSLIIDDVRIGFGDAVKEGDTVAVHYIGSTRDGVQFDSSYERGAPFAFTVGEGMVIEGWEKGLLGMKAGGQRILVIPPEMAYGNKQVGPIAAGSILVFAVELISIN